MKKCLGEQTLLLLCEGEGTDLERAHLKACWACAKRYHRLVRELEVIGRVLREEPPRETLYRSAESSSMRWVPLAAALGVTLAIFLGGMWARRVAFPVLPEESGTESVAFLEEVSTAVFSAANNDFGESLSPNFAYLREALGEE